MNLDKVCFEYWKKKGDSTQNDAADLYTRIQCYQANTLLKAEAQNLLEQSMCKNSKIRKIWVTAKRFIFHHILLFYKNADKDIAESSRRQLMDSCGAVMQQRVEKCLKTYDTNRSKTCDNQSIFTLLSGFIAESVHYPQVIKDCGFDYLKHEMEICVGDLVLPGEENTDIEADTFISTDPSPEQEVALNDLLEKIILKLQTKKNLVRLEAFVQECITGQAHKSQKARQQKTRFNRFLKEQWKLSDKEADYVIEKIEILLSEQEKPIF